MRWVLLAKLILLIHICAAQNISTDPLATFLSAEEGKLYKPAQISLLFVDLKSSEEIMSYEADKLVCPASVTKLLTGAYAFEKLGEGMIYKTTLSTTGQVHADGVLHGDLVWTACGDPSLGSKYAADNHQLSSIIISAVQAIKQAGIKCVDGDIVLDISASTNRSDHSRWLEMDVANYYGVSNHPLNVIDNSYSLHLRSSTSRVTVLGTTPEDIGLTIINRLSVGAIGSGDQAYIYGSSFSDERELRGSIPPSQSRFTIRGSLGDPSEYFLFKFSEALLEAEIEYGESRITTKNSSTNKDLQAYSSSQLSQLIRHSLAKSDNLYAQAIAETSLQSSNSTWQDITDWADCGSCKLYDGNGLSPSNALSAKSLVKVIQKTHEESSAFLRLLPTAQESRTLASYSKSLPIDALQAKTGSMESVRSLSGIITSASGSEIAFAILINHYDGTSREVYQSVAELLRTIHNMK